MKRVFASIILGLSLGLALPVAPAAHAADGVLRLAAADRYISLDEAVAKVRRMIDGEVISAKTRYVDDRPIHYVKVYDRGRVRTFRVDAATGRIM